MNAGCVISRWVWVTHYGCQAMGRPAPAILSALQARADHASALVREHVAWAFQQGKK